MSLQAAWETLKCHFKQSQYLKFGSFLKTVVLHFCTPEAVVRVELNVHSECLIHTTCSLYISVRRPQMERQT